MTQTPAPNAPLSQARPALIHWEITGIQRRSGNVGMWRFTRNKGVAEGFHNFPNYRLRVLVFCGGVER